mmetsp:Transcript_9689/g.35966  ORF Transcript_9689/g.35966 Transcript_9689/m.35966 type:complete len:337 (-) Transcript_9689:798-1808(-)
MRTTFAHAHGARLARSATLANSLEFARLRVASRRGRLEHAVPSRGERRGRGGLLHRRLLLLGGSRSSQASAARSAYRSSSAGPGAREGAPGRWRSVPRHRTSDEAGHRRSVGGVPVHHERHTRRVLLALETAHLALHHHGRLRGGRRLRRFLAERRHERAGFRAERKRPRGGAQSGALRLVFVRAGGGRGRGGRRRRQRGPRLHLCGVQPAGFRRRRVGFGNGRRARAPAGRFLVRQRPDPFRDFRRAPRRFVGKRAASFRERGGVTRVLPPGRGAGAHHGAIQVFFVVINRHPLSAFFLHVHVRGLQVLDLPRDARGFALRDTAAPASLNRRGVH